MRAGDLKSQLGSVEALRFEIITSGNFTQHRWILMNKVLYDFSKMII